MPTARTKNVRLPNKLLCPPTTDQLQLGKRSPISAAPASGIRLEGPFPASVRFHDRRHRERKFAQRRFVVEVEPGKSALELRSKLLGPRRLSQAIVRKLEQDAWPGRRGCIGNYGKRK